jgi:hypothetical protein
MATLSASIASEFHRSARKTNWKLGESGLRRINDYFFFPNELLANGDELRCLFGREEDQFYFEFLPFFLAVCGRAPGRRKQPHCDGRALLWPC